MDSVALFWIVAIVFVLVVLVAVYFVLLNRQLKTNNKTLLSKLGLFSELYLPENLFIGKDEQKKFTSKVFLIVKNTSIVGVDCDVSEEQKFFVAVGAAYSSIKNGFEWSRCNISDILIYKDLIFSYRLESSESIISGSSNPENHKGKVMMLNYRTLLQDLSIDRLQISDIIHLASLWQTI